MDYERFLKNTPEWKKIEGKFNKEGLASQLKVAEQGPRPKEFSARDCLSMRTWLSYAKIIGDDSYKKITNTQIDKIPGLDPAPFISI